MAYDPQVLHALETECGVTNVHLTALLRFFRSQQGSQAGKFSWPGRLGPLEQCVLEVHFSGRPYSVQQVSDAVLTGPVS